MKGITPIISIIILLLLTVGMAAAAWSYMSSYFSSITAKTIEISMQKCVTGSGANSGQDVLAVVHNMGTATIGIGNDIVILDKQGNAVIAGIAWTDIYGTPLTNIEPGKDGKVNIDCCGGSGAGEMAGQPSCPITCTYDVFIAGRSQTATAYCP